MSGTIRRRGNAWQLTVSAGKTADGTYRRRSRTSRATTKREALRELAAFVLEVESEHQSAGLTVGDVLDRWYAASARDWSPSTARNVATLVRRQLAELRPLDAEAFSVLDLEAFYDAARERGRAPATVAKFHAALRSAYKWATRRGLVVNNPTTEARPGKLGTAKVAAPEAAAVRALLAHAAAEDPELFLFVRLAAETGARRGELSALRLADFDGLTVSISRTIVNGPAGPELREETKTASSTRTIGISRELAGLVGAQRRRLIERATIAGASLPAGCWLFPRRGSGANRSTRKCGPIGSPSSAGRQGLAGFASTTSDISW